MNAERHAGGAADRSPRTRPALSTAGAAATIICLLPPVATLATRYVLAETVQFAVFSMVTPVLIALGAPWRALGLSASGTVTVEGTPVPGTRPFDRLADTRRRHRSFLRAAGYLALFMGATLVWRLPPVMDTLVRQPAVAVLEMVTLVATGTALWLELIDSAPLVPRLPRPQRAGLSALAMWFIWVIAYVIGLTNGAVFSAYGDLPGRALSLLADQQVAAAIMWTVAGFCFIPVVFASMFGWLKDSDDPDDELQRIVRDRNQRAVVKGWDRASRAPRAPRN